MESFSGSICWLVRLFVSLPAAQSCRCCRDGGGKSPRLASSTLTRQELYPVKNYDPTENI